MLISVKLFVMRASRPNSPIGKASWIERIVSFFYGVFSPYSHPKKIHIVFNFHGIRFSVYAACIPQCNSESNGRTKQTQLRSDLIKDQARDNTRCYKWHQKSEKNKITPIPKTASFRNVLNFMLGILKRGFNVHRNASCDLVNIHSRVRLIKRYTCITIIPHFGASNQNRLGSYYA